MKKVKLLAFERMLTFIKVKELIYCKSSYLSACSKRLEHFKFEKYISTLNNIYAIANRPKL